MESLRTPCIEVVTCEKHREQQDNPSVFFQSDIELDEFLLPGALAFLDNFGAIGSDHLLWICHKKRDNGSDEGEDQKSSLTGNVSTFPTVNRLPHVGPTVHYFDHVRPSRSIGRSVVQRTRYISL